jgi:hypothetical protein
MCHDPASSPALVKEWNGSTYYGHPGEAAQAAIDLGIISPIHGLIVPLSE